MKHLLRANLGLLIAGVATFVLMGAAQSLLGSALPVFAANFSLTKAESGLLVSSFWVGCAASVGFMYLRGHGIGPRHALAIMAAGSALMAVEPGWILTLIGAAVFGAGYGMATVVFNPRVLAAFGQHGTAMLSLLNATFGIGAIAAPLVFVALGQDPRIAFGACAALALAIWVLAGTAEGEAAPTPVPRGPFRPPFAFLLFAVFGIGLEASLGGLGPTALIASGIPQERAAELLSAFFVAFLGARVALVFTAHLVEPFRLYTGAMCTAALLAAVALMVSPAVGFVGLGACAALFFPCFYVAASRRLGDDARTAPTIIAAGLVGGICVPPTLSALMPHFGPRGFFLLVLVVATGTAVAGLIVARRQATSAPA
jgi:FHS family glucose/mannose:H+ symporter-like MFS transporter